MQTKRSHPDEIFYLRILAAASDDVTQRSLTDRNVAGWGGVVDAKLCIKLHEAVVCVQRAGITWRGIMLLAGERKDDHMMNLNVRSNWRKKCHSEKAGITSNVCFYSQCTSFYNWVANWKIRALCRQ